MTLQDFQFIKEEKEQVDQLLELVKHNTNKFYEIGKLAFKDFFENVSEVSMSEGSNYITAKISNQSISFHKVEGVSLLSDEDFVPEDVLNDLTHQPTNYLIGSKSRNFFTGMLVFSVKPEKDLENIIISRIFINEIQESRFKNILGWKETDVARTLKGFEEIFPTWIQTSVKNGLFEVKSNWDLTKATFDQASELNSLTDKIGFN